jgi:pimeloyl-[acyl-carrier protein] methyl ester esterase
MGNVAQPILILLPGLGGTGHLFEFFTPAISPEWPVRVMRLPSDRPRGYRELVECLLPELPPGPLAIIAESFSGPLAILLANRCPRVCALVLCASFVRPPLPAVLGRLPAFFWRRPPPALAVRLFMTGGSAVLANAVRQALRTVDSEVIRARVSAVLTVDVGHDLQCLAQPVLWLQAGRDRLIPACCSAIVRALKPSTEFACVDGPHLLLQTRPMECWRTIEPFLKQECSHDVE